MEMSCRSIDIVNLFRFMRLFGTKLFCILSTTENQISAVVAWPDDCQKGLLKDDDIQEILWRIPENNIDDALILGEFAYDNGWISSDKIIIPQSKLQNEINWSFERFNKSIETLLSLRVSMIDNGEETDAFFIHF